MTAHVLFAIAAAATVTACTGVIVQDAPAPRSSYHENDFDYATRHGAILTVVAGNPFDGSKGQFDDLVRGLMYGQNREQAADFVAEPNGRTSPPYKVVVAFNKAPPVSHDEMCANPKGVPTVQDKKQLRIDLAFCHGDEEKSGTSGYAYDVSGTSHLRFGALVRQATYTMLPPEGDTRNNEESENVRP